LIDEREELRKLYYNTDDVTAATFIPAVDKRNIYDWNREFRVCAYCRVSTDNDAQLSSFELQQQHYRQLVGQRPNWKLLHIFADEGTPYGQNAKSP
jgi:site-specific DNA recombinase